MTDDRQGYRDEAPIDGAPTWLRALQAALIGLVAGLALHALFSFVVLHGETRGPKHPGPSQCKKANPARDIAVPSISVPRNQSHDVAIVAAALRPIDGAAATATTFLRSMAAPSP